MPPKGRPGLLSRATRAALDLMGSEIRLARKARRMTEAELGERIGCSRDTVRAIEAGKSTVTVGFMFEAAAVLDLGLMGGPERVASQARDTHVRLALMPQSSRKTRKTKDQSA